MFHPEGPTFRELMGQALSSTERGYDLLATKFDRTPFRTPDQLLAAIAPYVSNQEGGPPGRVGSALDLCCGTGAALHMLRPLCRDRLVGVDLSRGMLAEARRQLDGGDGVEVELERRDALDLGWENEFDLVTCFGAFGHIARRHQPRLVAEVARVLKPGGRFLFVTAPWPRLWSWRLWVALAFNGAIALRNVLWRPPFHMYYLSFLLPRARRLLEHQGFRVEVYDDVYPEISWIRLVVASLPPR